MGKKGFKRCYSCTFYIKETHNSGYCEKRKIHGWGGNQKSCMIYKNREAKKIILTRRGNPATNQEQYDSKEIRIGKLPSN